MHSTTGLLGAINPSGHCTRKASGTSRRWKVTAGYIWRSWPEWKVAFQGLFDDRQSLIQWQEKVSACEQGKSETLVNYLLATLNILTRCPVTLADKQQVEYVIQGIRDKQVATAIVTEHLETVAAFLDVVTELDQTPQYVRMQPADNKCETVYQTMPSAKPRASFEKPQRSASISPTSLALRPQTAQCFSMSSPEQRVTRYNNISTKHGAPIFWPGQNTNEAICCNCCGAGQFSSKCPQQKSLPPSSRPPNAFSNHALDELEVLKLVCIVVPANVAVVRDINGFPDSGSKMTIILSQLVRHVTPLP